MSKHIYYFHSTHWDREWYQSFQAYRKYLIDTTERILNLLEDGTLEKYTFDGQTIVLKDILELRPGLRPRLEKLIQEGRLNVGPWYVMPDEFLVSAEAMLRNLQVGREIAREFGHEPWTVGYVCDIFGHSSQMPQLLAGYGLVGAVVWRGFPQELGPAIVWEGADGTKLPSLRLNPYGGYGEFNLKTRGSFILDYTEQELEEQIDSWIELSKNFYNGDAVICTDALDHAFPAAQARQVFAILQRKFPGAKVAFSDYTDFFATEFQDLSAVPVVKGEQILASPVPRSGIQISPTLSSRYDVKLANDTCQNRLELSLEPLFATRLAQGAPEPPDTLRYAWRLLLQNHAHDSICGCSIDEVHRQVLARLEEEASLIDIFTEDFLHRDRERITGQDIYHQSYDRRNTVDFFRAEDGRYLFRVFNPLPYVQPESVREFTLAIPCDFPEIQSDYGIGKIDSFTLHDENGTDIPYSIRSIRRNQLFRDFRNRQTSRDLYRISFPATLTPAGWTTFEVRPSHIRPIRHFQTQLVARQTADNGILRLEVAQDGTFRVTDHRNGRTYGPYNNYRFDTEIGDGWFHVEAPTLPTITGSSQATIRITHDSPHLTEFQITRRYIVPRQLLFQAGIHDNYTGTICDPVEVALDLVTTVALAKNSHVLRLTTTLDNCAKDYRLRLAVPTHIQGDYFVHQHGAFVWHKENRENGDLTENYNEKERVGRNFEGIVGKRDEQGGIAFLCKAGLHEAGGVTSEDGELFVTLLRAFRRTVQTNGEVDGQLQKRLEWEYALDFFATHDQNWNLLRDLQELRVERPSYLIPSSVVATEAIPGYHLLTVGPGLVLSCLKPAADGEAGTLVLRLLNPGSQPISSWVKFPDAVRKVVACRLDETPLRDLTNDTQRFDIQIGAYAFATYRISL
ncbi:MAG: hypothetical protein IJJ26_10545 [Victivallales bacterium]|nr:hypothetical protein [Victivallales bacterium]